MEEPQAWKESMVQLDRMDSDHTMKRLLKKREQPSAQEIAEHIDAPLEADGVAVTVDGSRITLANPRANGFPSGEEILASDLTELYCLLRNIEGQLFNLGAEHSAYMVKAFALQVIRPLCESYEKYID